MKLVTYEISPKSGREQRVGVATNAQKIVDLLAAADWMNMELCRLFSAGPESLGE